MLSRFSNNDKEDTVIMIITVLSAGGTTGVQPCIKQEEEHLTQTEVGLEGTVRHSGPGPLFLRQRLT